MSVDNNFTLVERALETQHNEQWKHGERLSELEKLLFNAPGTAKREAPYCGNTEAAAQRRAEETEQLAPDAVNLLHEQLRALTERVEALENER